MDIKKLHNKKIAILGLGIENLSLVKFLLRENGEKDITVCDYRPKKQLGERYRMLNKKVKWQLGKNYKKNLHKFDILFRAPGWTLRCPSIEQAERKNKKLVIYSPIKLFFDLCPAKIIGVTGSKGKGTTSTLIYNMLKEGGKDAHLGGNIGKAPFDFYGKLKKNSWVVLELSSFQLEDMKKSPEISVITNLFPEHLAPADPVNPNYHLDYHDYFDAKLNIVKHQRSQDWQVLNGDDQQVLKAAGRCNKSKKIYFSTRKKLSRGCWVQDDKIMLRQSGRRQAAARVSDIRLKGQHNVSNVCASVMAAKLAGVSVQDIRRTIGKFKGLEHRLEFVRKVNGVSFYNDTFATAPESAITAIKAFKEPKILILGGADKGVSFKELAREIGRSEVRGVVLVGKTAPRLRASLRSALRSLRVRDPSGSKTGSSRTKTQIKLLGYKKNMRGIVREAVKMAKSGDVVLLSPGCASFDMFTNYKARGALFKKAVREL